LTTAPSHILSIPSPFSLENAVIKVLEAPDTDQRGLLRRLHNGQYEKPFVVDDGRSRALYFSFAFVQSAMQVRHPNALELPYTRKMMSFLLFQPRPKNILMLGLGGGSLAKFCHRHLPDSQITVVEINPHVVAFRDEFTIPPDSDRFQVVINDAAEYVATACDNFEVIVIDAFDKDGFPGSTCNREFFGNLRRILDDNGLLVFNLAGRRAEKVAQRNLLDTLFNQGLLAVPLGRDENQIVLAFNNPEFAPCWEIVHRQATLLSARYGLEFERFARKFERSQKQPGLEGGLRSTARAPDDEGSGELRFMDRRPVSAPLK